MDPSVRSHLDCFLQSRNTQSYRLLTVSFDDGKAPGPFSCPFKTRESGREFLRRQNLCRRWPAGPETSIGRSDGMCTERCSCPAQERSSLALLNQLNSRNTSRGIGSCLTCLLRQTSWKLGRGGGGWCHSCREKGRARCKDRKMPHSRWRWT